MKNNIHIVMFKSFVIGFAIIYCCQLIAMQAPKPSMKLYPAPKIYEPITTNLDDIEHIKDQLLIKHYINFYTKGNHLYNLIKRSKPFLKYVLSELNKRNLPKELALLPIIESSYRPTAVSNKGATGIWQISYVTGKRYGLIYNQPSLTIANDDNNISASNNKISNNNIIDSRYNLKASTNAALEYLDFLYKEFNNDWLLALAAYNAGEGRVKKAIRYNEIIGKNVTYWTLNLPKQTKHFVPKILALSIIFKDPKKFGLNFDDL